MLFFNGSIYIERGKLFRKTNIDIKISIYNGSMKTYRYENEYIEK
jgi:hypothetical protein